MRRTCRALYLQLVLGRPLRHSRVAGGEGVALLASDVLVSGVYDAILAQAGVVLGAVQLGLQLHDAAAADTCAGHQVRVRALPEWV